MLVGCGQSGAGVRQIDVASVVELLCLRTYGSQVDLGIECRNNRSCN